MWKLEFHDGTSLDDSQVEYWDKVPYRLFINKAYIQISNETLTFENFDYIVIAKLGGFFLGSGNIHIGYVVTEVREDLKKYIETKIKFDDTIERTEYDLSNLSIPPECFRTGIKRYELEKI